MLQQQVKCFVNSGLLAYIKNYVFHFMSTINRNQSRVKYVKSTVQVAKLSRQLAGCFSNQTLPLQPLLTRGIAVESVSALGALPLIQRPPAVLCPTQTGDLLVLDGELVVVGDLLVDVNGLSGVDYDLLL